MRKLRLLSVLVVPAIFACSDTSTSPNPGQLAASVGKDIGPLAPCNYVKVTASAPITRPHNSGPYNGIYKVSNPCTSGSFSGDLTSSRTGSVTTVGTPSPSFFSGLGPGQSVTVSVAYHVGAVGTGTVVLKATNDAGTLVRTGTLTVTVN